MKLISLPLGQMGTNCYIVYDEGGSAAVVDPGGEAEVVIKWMTDYHLTPKAIFLTHGHFDHTGAVADLRSAWPEVPVYIHREELGKGDPLHFVPVSNTCHYDEGDQIAIGDMTFQVLHTPGHSTGSVTLLCGQLMLCGDTLFRGSMGRTDFPGGSYGQIMASLARLARLEGNYRVLPGHMDESTLDYERKTNYYVREALSSL